MKALVPRVSDEEARDVYENVSRVVIAYGDVRVHDLAADLLYARKALEAAGKMRLALGGARLLIACAPPEYATNAAVVKRLAEIERARDAFDSVFANVGGG